jgi:hypothetical protein
VGAVEHFVILFARSCRQFHERPGVIEQARPEALVVFRREQIRHRRE